MTDRSILRKRFEANRLMDKARELTGLNDFGNGDFRIGLEKFVAGLTEEGQLPLTAVGEAVMESTAIRFLVNRLRFESDLKKHPEILNEILLPPIIIMGLPRSGTTKLQRLMAADERLQSLRTWQIMNPAPFPEGPGKDGRDPRIAAAEEVDAMIDALMPQLMAGHPVRAEYADEEAVTLMEMNFDYVLLGMRIESPTYQAWLKTRPSLPIYRDLFKWLQYLQWQTARRDKPYLLKAPLHMSNLDALLEVFPGATLVHCHREPKEAVTSFMRLAEIPRSVLYSNLDPHKMGTWLLELAADHVQKNGEQRVALADRLHIIDVAFRDITRNPFAVLEKIYLQHGMKLPTETREAMLEWDRGHPGNLYGKFSYDMAHYGKTAADFDSAFLSYRQQFATLI